MSLSTNVCSFRWQVVCSPRCGSVCPQGPETAFDNWLLLTVCTGTVSPTGAQQGGGGKGGWVGGQKRGKWWSQSPKLMSLICPGRRQLVAWQPTSDTEWDALPFLPKHTSLWCVSGIFFPSCPNPPIETVLYRGIVQTQFILYDLKDFGR